MKLQNEIDCKQKKSQIKIFEEELLDMKKGKNKSINQISSLFFQYFPSHLWKQIYKLNPICII